MSLSGGTKVQVIKDGFQGTEGPITLPDGSLIFTYDGKPFGRPNDLVLGSRGGVYFTEPGPNVQPGAPPPPLPPALYYVPPGGKTVKIADGIERPNGVMLSRDEKTLYVNNTAGEYLLAFDVQADGTVRNRRNFARYQGVTNTASGVVSGADGLALDSEGRLCAATSAGVEVFSPAGQHLGTIPFSRAPQNLAFAGPAKNILYVVGRGAAFKVQMIAVGLKGRAK